MSIVNIILGFNINFNNMRDLDEYLEIFYPMGKISEVEF